MSIKKQTTRGKIIIISCLALLFMFVLASCTFKTNPYVNSLNVDMALNEDGSADIVHTRTINFDSRDKEWWNYYLRINLADNNTGNFGNKVSQLKDLSIKVNGENYPIDLDLSTKNLDNFTDSQKNAYKGKGYAYYSSLNEVEIGVVMPMFGYGVRTVAFSYTLTNLMIEYTDCVGLYYKFVDESESNYIENFTAKVSFNKLNSIQDIAVWTHIDNGSAANSFDSESLSSVSYVGEKISEGTYLETRLLLKNSSYTSNKKNTASFSDIVAEEVKWQEDYAKEVRKAQVVRVLDYILAAVAVAFSILATAFIKKKLKHKPLDNAPIYYREIPKGWTAGEMAPLYHYYAPKFEVSDSMSATILELCRRRYIEIDVGGKKQATITIINTNPENLRGHERIVLNMLLKTSVAFGGSFTMKDLEKHASKNYTSFANDVESYEKSAKSKTVTMGCYPNKAQNKFFSVFNALTGAYFIITLAIIFNTIFLGIGSLYFWVSIFGFIIGTAVLFFSKSTIKVPLTNIGQENYDMFNALGKFMQEFSNMKDHELPQLVLWEEFMVYATAMGIADKVSEQIEIAYPEYKEIVNNSYHDNRYNNTFLILYLMSPRVRMSSNFAISSTMRSINSNVTNMARQAKIAATAKKFGGGVGGGGGFRGGGGGFGGGGGGAR